MFDFYIRATIKNLITKLMIKKLSIALSFLAMFTLVFLSSCKKDESSEDKNGNNNTSGEFVLLIETGAQSLNLGATLNYSAVLVKSNGEVTPATGVTWATSDQKIAIISAGGAISTKGAGAITVTASVTVNGKTYSAAVPLAIAPPSVFGVAPSAIIWGVNDGPMQLEPIYFGTGSPTYAYASSNNNIASVSNTGLVTFNAVGTCEITVTANGLNGNPEVVVPVMVVGAPAIPLPVTKVVVTPNAHDMFRGETMQFTAKAYNANNAEVLTTIQWKVLDPEVGSISSTGLFTANQIGKTTIQAVAQGMVGQAEVIVNPDTLIIVDPLYVSVPAGGTQQFTAKTYKINRSNRSVSEIPNPAGLKWEMPTYGISIFDIGTVDNTGKVTLKTGAMPGMQSFVIAYVDGSETIDAGVGTIMVGIADPCNCGPNNPNVASIGVNQTVVNLSFGGQHQIVATPRDASQNPVSGAAVVYCSDNEAVATVDSNGEVNATGLGSAKITVCVGNIKTSVNVTVSF